MSKLRISIAGCGWLGLQAGKHLTQAGFEVKGSTTTQNKIPALAEKGIQPFLIDFTDEASFVNKDFFNADVIIISISPSRNKGKYATMVENICKHTRARIVLISTTGVYPQVEGIYDEDSPVLENEITAAENAVKTNADSWLILRCAGLFGEGRDPGRFLAGKTDVTQPHSPVNLVHGTDVVNCIHALLNAALKNEIYNLCSPYHPKREEFYTRCALQSGLIPPVFLHSGPHPQRIITAQKIMDKLTFTFSKSAKFLGYI